jgi:hypothetical protein
LGEAAKEIFREKGLSEESTWETLIEHYGGNPLNLKIVSTRIRDLFNGLCSEFLKGNTFVFGGIVPILEREFNRLTSLEKDVMRWMANERKPVSLEDMLKSGSSIRLIDLIEDAIDSLLRRSLIEKTSGGTALFTLQPVVMEYVADKFLDEESTKSTQET